MSQSIWNPINMYKYIILIMTILLPLYTRIRDVTLDIAESRQTRQDRAYAVESCQCPVGYRGLSCEDCDTGYTRTGGGLYLGLCEPCRCNGHSGECDPESGVCRVRLGHFLCRHDHSNVLWV